MDRFVAIDFETATHRRDSACAVGLTEGREGRIKVSRTFLIRPPEREFSHTRIHGIEWDDVCDAPTFGELWPTLHRFIDGAEFLAAHNAPFDRSVLYDCCSLYGVAAPQMAFVCTVRLARRPLGIYPAKLPNVCRRLEIPLNHHDPGRDAEACARIVLAAQSAGWRHSPPSED